MLSVSQLSKSVLLKEGTPHAKEKFLLRVILLIRNSASSGCTALTIKKHKMRKAAYHYIVHPITRYA